MQRIVIMMFIWGKFCRNDIVEHNNNNKVGLLILLAILRLLHSRRNKREMQLLNVSRYTSS